MVEYVTIEDEDDALDFKDYLDLEADTIEFKEEVDGLLVRTNDYDAFVPEKYRHIIQPPPTSKYDNHLIYGKNPTEGIVACEVDDSKLILYMNDGTTQEKPMIYWILTPKPIKGSKKLEGDLHYKYATEFKTNKEFRAATGFLKSKGKDFYTVWDPREAAMIYYGFTLFKGLKVEDVSVLSFDIEAAGLNHDSDSKVFLITNTLRSGSKTIKKHFRVDEYGDNDIAMIQDWCEWVVEQDPTVITGHNIYGYDFPYIQHCYGKPLPLGKNGEEAKLSNSVSRFRVDGNTSWDYNKINILGRHIIDGMFLAVKHDIERNYPSWGLKQIAEYEGLIKEGRQFYDASKIRDNWCNPVEREKIVAYGKDDSDDSLALYDLMIPSIFYMSQYLPKTFQNMGVSASGSQLNALMVRAYIQEGHSIPKASEHEYVAGGMSYGIPGIYKNVIKWDAKSFYPSTILAYNIYDKIKDPKAYYYEMVKYFTYRRFQQKEQYVKTGDKYYDDLQAASKVFANSAYGLLGVSGLNFNSPNNAIKITQLCRSSLQKTILWATGKDTDYWWPEYKEMQTSSQDLPDFNKIDSKAKVSFNEMSRHNWLLTNIDTDALSFCKPDMRPFTDEEYKQIHREINEIMYCEWEEDGKFPQFIVSKAKNYIMVDESGEVTKKGSSLTDTKKEPALLELLNELIDDILKTGGKLAENIYNKYIYEAYNIEDISRWATKKSVTKSVLNPTRTNEQKVLDAIKRLDPREGDKVYLYSAIDGKVQNIVKGEPVFLKNGNPKMVENRILKTVEQWNGDEDKMHYVKRVYMTVEILKNVIDTSGFIKYHLKSNRHLLEEL